MTTNLDNFGTGSLVGATLTASTTSSERKHVWSATLANTHTDNVEVQVWLQPSGTTLTTANRLTLETVPAGGKAHLVRGLANKVLDRSYVLTMTPGVDSVVQYDVSGISQT